MHQDKHTLLASTGLSQVVQAVAVRFSVTVDDVMHGGHGRSVPAAARSAFAALEPDARRTLKDIPWPFTCPGCGELAEALITCSGCPATGCEGCAVPGKCPSCRRIEKDRQNALDRKAAQQRLRAARG